MTGIFLSLVQLVAGVTIANQPCPAYQRAPEAGALYWSCYDPAVRTIYLARQDRTRNQRRPATLHEYGHAYDIDSLTDADRAMFTRLLRYRSDRGWWQEAWEGEPPAEEFANAYADCAMGKARPFRSMRGHYRRFCSLLPPSHEALLLGKPRH